MTGFLIVAVLLAAYAACGATAFAVEYAYTRAYYTFSPGDQLFLCTMVAGLGPVGLIGTLCTIAIEQLVFPRD